jgi:hypothetical protein
MLSNCVHSFGLIQNTQSIFEVLRALHIDNKSCMESTVYSLVYRYQCCREVATFIFRGVLKTVYSLPWQTPLKLLYLQTHLHSFTSQKIKILHLHDCLSLLYTLPSKWRTSFFPTHKHQHNKCTPALTSQPTKTKWYSNGPTNCLPVRTSKVLGCLFKFTI